MALALLWWAWAGFAWLTSVIDPEEGSVRIVMFAAMSALVVAALAVPESFGARALTFAVAYGVVRVAYVALFLVPGRDDATLRHTVLVFAAEQRGRDRPARRRVVPRSRAADRALGGRDRARLRRCAHRRSADGRSCPMHFAERHNLIIILALGESIIALGVGTHVELTPPVTLAVVLGVALASALWWIYFDIVAIVTEQRLERVPAGRERNCLARDAYSYVHLLMVTGIVLAAFGLEHVLEHVSDPLDAEHCFALLGGVAIYLLGHVALRLRSAHTLNVRRLVLAARAARRGTARDHGRRAGRARGRERVAVGDDRVRDAPCTATRATRCATASRPNRARRSVPTAADRGRRPGRVTRARPT